MKIAKSLMMAAAASVMLGGVALAAGDGMKKPTGPIAERQQVMKEVKNNFVPLVKMVKGAQPFDAATVKKNAEAIAALLEKAGKLFPEGSDKGDTRAKDEIWMMPEEFEAVRKTAIEKAKALANVSSADQLAPAVMALGGNGCKACHKKFRKPKEKKKM